MEAVYGLASLASKQNELKQAVTLCAFLLHQPPTPAVIKAQTASLLESAQSSIRSKELTDLLNAGRQMSLEQVVAHVKRVRHQISRIP